MVDLDFTEPDNLEYVEFPWSPDQTFDISIHKTNQHVIIECTPHALTPERLIVPLLEFAAACDSVDELGDYATRLIQRVVGCDQVMLYRFDDTYHGEAISESRAEQFPSYHKRWFPEGDIPLPARIVMVKRPVGVTINNQDDGSALVTLESSLPEIDLSRCVYRLPSKMCSQYYQNMGIHGTAVASIMHDAKLWGFFSCWNYERPIFISMRLRRELQSLTDVFIDSYQKIIHRNNQKVIKQLRDNHDQLLSRLVHSEDMASALSRLEGLADALPSSGAALILPDRMTVTGVTPPKDFIHDFADWLQATHANVPLFSHRNLSSVYQPAAEHVATASGVLALRLGRRSASYLLWFRPEIEIDVPWAGEPVKPIDPLDPEQRLQPRSSFALWIEHMKGYSKPWQDHELEMVSVFRDELMVVLHELANHELTILLERANEAQRARKSLLANVSHDLRTPINGVLANAEMLSKELQTGEYQDMASDIVESSSVLLRLLNDLLDQARLEAGGMAIKQIATHLPDLGKRLKSTLASLARKKSVSLTFSTRNCDDVRVLIDPDRVLQILTNLASNAIKFTEENTEVLISAELLGEEGNYTLELNVEDSGRGIPPEKRKAIFKAFEQVEDDDARIHNGAGLGLSIVHGLVGLMEGSIDVLESASGGSIFRVQLPIEKVLQEVVESTGASTVLDNGYRSLKGYKLLVAEDNPVNLRIVKALLKRTECEAEFVTDGQQAVTAAAGQKFDLLVFDINMPNLNGDEALQQIRAGEDANATTPAIAATANSDTEYEAELRELGFEEFCAKPINIEEFVSKSLELVR